MQILSKSLSECWNVDVSTLELTEIQVHQHSTSLPSSFPLQKICTEKNIHFSQSFIHSLHSAIFVSLQRFHFLFKWSHDDDHGGGWLNSCQVASKIYMVTKWERGRDGIIRNCWNENQTNVIAHSLWPIRIAILVGLCISEQALQRIPALICRRKTSITHTTKMELLSRHEITHKFFVPWGEKYAIDFFDHGTHGIVFPFCIAWVEKVWFIWW